MATPSIGAMLDGRLDRMENTVAGLKQQQNETDKKVNNLGHELESVKESHRALEKTLGDIQAKQESCLASLSALQAPLGTLTNVEGMVKELGQQYSNMHEEVARQKELQETLLEQHNDLRITVHRQQPSKSLAVRSVSASSNTFRHTSPAPDPNEDGINEENALAVPVAQKRTASMRDSVSYENEHFDANGARIDSVPSSLKRRKGKDNLKESPSSPSAILYDHTTSNDDVIMLSSGSHLQPSPKLPLQSPGSRKILDMLKDGKDHAKGQSKAKELLRSFGSTKAKRSTTSAPLSESPVAVDPKSAETQGESSPPVPRRSNREKKSAMHVDMIHWKDLKRNQVSMPTAKAEGDAESMGDFEEEEENEGAANPASTIAALEKKLQGLQNSLATTVARADKSKAAKSHSKKSA